MVVGSILLLREYNMELYEKTIGKLVALIFVFME
jgi:hypothetical protein